MKTRDARIYKVQVNELAGKRKSYTARWKVGTARPTSRTFAKSAPAERFRSDLMAAQTRGELFDTETGLPESMVAPVDQVSFLDHTIEYMTMKWPGSAAKSRAATVEALVTVIPALCADAPGQPTVDELRAVLKDHLLPPPVREVPVPARLAPAAAWLNRASVLVKAIEQGPIVRRALDALALKLDGKPAAATTVRRKRAVFYNVLQYAVDLERIEFNPVDKVRVVNRRKKVVIEVDRRVVVNPRTARELLTAVTYVGRRGDRGARLRAFFAAMYFGALRPGEGLGLREADCRLPATCNACGEDVTTVYGPGAACGHDDVTCGWGLLTLESTRPQAGKRWTDSGQVHDDRGLKHRGDRETRPVPATPELVRHLRSHIRTYGLGPDGRLFRSPKGNPVAASTYLRVWEEARTYALLPAQLASPLAGRPYDLRHGAVSLWLNNGVPATSVAERAGQSVDVLLRIYAKCIDGDTATVNARIEAAYAG